MENRRCLASGLQVPGHFFARFGTLSLGDLLVTQSRRWALSVADSAAALDLSVTATGRPGVVALSRMEWCGTLDTRMLNHHMAMMG